jgi:D-alanyl-D-alanine carboxypeptidase/D-alanyl-D-alanine-endopeptidase (penicillin-binding protein 4)
MRDRSNYFKSRILLLCIALCCAACSVNQRIAKKVDRQFKASPVADQYHLGFALYDPADQHLIYGRNEDTYYTPASNTKLFTFYAGLKMIPDSIPSLRYVVQGDSLIFWGTGDPSFLQTELKGLKAYEFLKNSGKKLFFAPGRYSGNFYGKGWSWDDYNDYYQAEINELPVIDNLLRFQNQQNKLVVSPATLNNCVVLDSANRSGEFLVTRAFDQNLFKYPNVPVPASYDQKVPYKTSTNLTLNLLTDTLRKPVGLIQMSMPESAKIIYNMASDSVFKAMLLPSSCCSFIPIRSPPT